MKVKRLMAQKVANAALSLAKKACGSASYYGTYQAKEPAYLKKICK